MFFRLLLLDEKGSFIADIHVDNTIPFLTVQHGHTGLSHIQNTGLDKEIFEHKIVNILFPISFNICFG